MSQSAMTTSDEPKFYTNQYYKHKSAEISGD